MYNWLYFSQIGSFWNQFVCYHNIVIVIIIRGSIISANSLTLVQVKHKEKYNTESKMAPFNLKDALINAAKPAAQMLDGILSPEDDRKLKNAQRKRKGIEKLLSPAEEDLEEKKAKTQESVVWLGSATKEREETRQRHATEMAEKNTNFNLAQASVDRRKGREDNASFYVDSLNMNLMQVKAKEQFIDDLPTHRAAMQDSFRDGVRKEIGKQVQGHLDYMGDNNPLLSYELSDIQLAVLVARFALFLETWFWVCAGMSENPVTIQWKNYPLTTKEVRGQCKNLFPWVDDDDKQVGVEQLLKLWRCSPFNQYLALKAHRMTYNRPTQPANRQCVLSDLAKETAVELYEQGLRRSA